MGEGEAAAAGAWGWCSRSLPCVCASRGFMVPLKRDGCVCVDVGGGSQDKRARQCSRRTNCPPKSRSLHSARTLALSDGKTRRGGMGGDR